MSNTRNPRSRSNRRRFLKSVVAGGSTAAIAAAAGLRPAVAEEKPAAPAPTAAPKGYHMTAHIEDYYKVARF